MSTPVDTSVAPDLERLARDLAEAKARIVHLEGIIARSTSERLDASRFYITPQDMVDSIEITRRHA